MITRSAQPTDDLTVLWPEITQRKPNLDQIIVVEDAGSILAGAFFFDGGHDVVFVAEARNIAPPARHKHVTKRLHDGIWEWVHSRGKIMAIFHCAQGQYAAMLQRRGARIVATNLMLLTILIDRPRWEDAPCVPPISS